METWVASEKLGTSPQISLLAGDGSQRKFYRVSIGRHSYVVIDDADWIFSKDYAPHQEYLHEQGIPVPCFLKVDEAAGIGVLEDLGDELLQLRLKSLEDNRTKMMSWLRRSVTLLAELHGKTFPVPKTLPVASRFFDEEKYFQEMSFTWQHLVSGFLEVSTPFPEVALRHFCKTIGDLQPHVFCHRDYHTRNILVFNDELFLIDFQDARLGSPAYDLASLVYDAYVTLSANERKSLVQHYRQSVNSFSLGKKISWDRFPQDLNRVGLQRVVKAAGSFASFYTRYQKPSHLSYLLPALSLAQTLVEDCRADFPELAELFPIEIWISQSKRKLQKIGIPIS